MTRQRLNCENEGSENVLIATVSRTSDMPFEWVSPH